MQLKILMEINTDKEKGTGGNEENNNGNDNPMQGSGGEGIAHVKDSSKVKAGKEDNIQSVIKRNTKDFNVNPESPTNILHTVKAKYSYSFKFDKWVAGEIKKLNEGLEEL